MDRGALHCRDRGPPGYRAQIGKQVIDGQISEACTREFQLASKSLERRRDIFFRILEEHAARNADAQSGKRKRNKCRELLARHHRVGCRTFGDGAGKRADGIEPREARAAPSA